MSLLQDAANYEEQHWRNRLSGWRRQAARDYLGQIGKIAVLLVLTVLLLDGARRDITHSTAHVVAVTGGVTLQTANNTHAPAQSFVGQTYALGDTITTDATGTVTLAFSDSTVIQLGPNNQLQQTQSDSYRTGIRRRYFQTGVGPLQIHNPSNVKLTLAASNGGGIEMGGGGMSNAYFGSNNAASLARYATRPGFLEGVERIVWWPLDLILGKLGVMSRGTLLGTDSQRLQDAQTICKALQKTIPTQTSLVTGKPIPLDSLGLSADELELAKQAITGGTITLKSAGPGFVARLKVHDSMESVLEVTAQNISKIGPVKL
jgi:hypothetical protein